MNYYVYKYVTEFNEIVYIGSTNDLKRRIKEHASGFGIERKFIPYLDKTTIFYHRCCNSTEMKALETLLINHHKPILNVIDVQAGQSTIETTVQWNVYNEHDFNEHLEYLLQKYNKLLKSNMTRIKNYQAKQEELIRRMNYMRPFYSHVNNLSNHLAQNPYASIRIPRRYTPKEDFIFVTNRLVSPWYDEQEFDNEDCIIQFSGEFLREIFAVSHKDNWIDQTMDMIGNNQCRELSAKIAGLSSTNKKLKQNITSIKNELLAK